MVCSCLMAWSALSLQSVPCASTLHIPHYSVALNCLPGGTCKHTKSACSAMRVGVPAVGACPKQLSEAAYHDMTVCPFRHGGPSEV